MEPSVTLRKQRRKKTGTKIHPLRGSITHLHTKIYNDYTTNTMSTYKVNTIQTITDEHNIKLSVHNLNLNMNVCIQLTNGQKKNGYIESFNNTEITLRSSRLNDSQFSEYLLDNISLVQEYEELKQKEQALIEQGDTETFSSVLKQRTNLVQRYIENITGEINGSKMANITLDEIECQCLPEKRSIDNFDYEDGFYVCCQCGLVLDEFHLSESLSFKESQNNNIKTPYQYKKVNHFMEWLSRIQCKENVEIPDEIIDKIKLEMKKERIKNYDDIDDVMIKRYLKNIGHSKYYENIYTIIQKLTGKSNLILSQELEQKLEHMFLLLQKPFEKYRGTRKNFLSYSYVLYQFFHILHLDEYCKTFKLLKSMEKLKVQEEIFKKMIKDLRELDTSVDWKCVPTA